MAVNKDGLTAYVSQNQSDLILKAQFGAPSVKYFNKMLNVKGATTLNLLNTKVSLKPLGCDFSDNSAVTLSQRTINAVPVAVNAAYCEKDFVGTWMQNDLLFKAGVEKLPFEQKFAEDLVNGAASEIEKIMWQGDTSKGTLNAFDGIIKIAEASTLAATNTYAAGSTISSIVDGLIAKLPTEVYSAGTPVIYMGVDSYIKYLQELRANGNLVINQAGWDTASAPESIIAPLSRGVKVIGVPGLDTTGKFFASYMENFYFGTDIDDAMSAVDVFYSRDHQQFRAVLKTVAGVQIAFPDLLVEAKAA